ncbi:MAG: hypothetical protein IE931_07590 [Sphingobacteriales bacterium]|jgi:hypothetical protein|nr:hypothetical protein [Sphingobacteriales bacterium]MCE2786401.1 hypothetical protein [Sphingobacteriales bacterium]
MNNELNLYHKILFLELRPWTNREVAETKYKELMQGISKEHFSFQPLYEVDFPKPLTAKRKYYFSIIENEATNYLNNFQQIIAGALNEKEKQYWVHTTLTKVLSQKLREVSKVIDDSQYFFQQLSAASKASTPESKIQDEAYILQYLKYQLIRIYLEIQETFSSHLKEEAISEEELHQQYFSEQAPSKSFIIEAVKLNLPLPASQVTAKPQTVQFTVKAFDFRTEKKGIIPYEAIIKDSGRFSRFEEELFSHELIDENYNFKNQHGQIQELAAIFQTLIKKGYFNKRQFPKNKEIKPVDIRKFLDHRYNSNTDKQFRTWANKPDELADFVSSKYWIDKLPTS